MRTRILEPGDWFALCVTNLKNYEQRGKIGKPRVFLNAAGEKHFYRVVSATKHVDITDNGVSEEYRLSCLVLDGELS